MHKKVILFIVSCLLFLSVQTCVLAANISSLPELEVSKTVELSERTRENEFATKAEAVCALEALIKDGDVITLEANSESLSVKVFLEALAQLRGYCRVVNGNIVYPMGDSIWLTADEWNELSDNLYRPISLETINKIVERTITCDEFVKNHTIPVSYELYKEEIDAFYSEYSELLHNNSAAAKYWIGEMNKKTIYDPDKFSSIMHEIAHEQSTKKSGAFQRRYVTAGTWGVYWSSMPNHIWSFNSKTKCSTELVVYPIPKTLDLIKREEIPEDVQKTVYYKVYFSKDSMSNLIGVYGMLEELCASSIDVRMNVIESSLKNTSFYEDTLQSIYFWKGAIGEYLIHLKENNPNIYNKLIGSNFSDMLSDILNFIDEQNALVNIIPTSTKDVIALRTWSEADEIQNILNEFTAAAKVSNINQN